MHATTHPFLLLLLLLLLLVLDWFWWQCLNCKHEISAN
jgi:hypothetical protein